MFFGSARRMPGVATCVQLILVVVLVLDCQRGLEDTRDENEKRCGFEGESGESVAWKTRYPCVSSTWGTRFALQTPRLEEAMKSKKSCASGLQADCFA